MARFYAEAGRVISARSSSDTNQACVPSATTTPTPLRHRGRTTEIRIDQVDDIIIIFVLYIYFYFYFFHMYICLDILRKIYYFRRARPPDVVVTITRRPTRPPHINFAFRSTSHLTFSSHGLSRPVRLCHCQRGRTDRNVMRLSSRARSSPLSLFLSLLIHLLTCTLGTSDPYPSSPATPFARPCRSPCTAP